LTGFTGLTGKQQTKGKAGAVLILSKYYAKQKDF
jgi:hypothetical protein